ncbi:MAG: NAD(P)-dependent oxidoreductase [Candidatus Aminicenantes bacterium]|nr:NAD(P)-dependent oxidoreductase [Candidatus Aminicenantes bacterium]
MRVLITGATGFIGWHLAEYLKNAGYQVQGLIRDPNKAAFLDSAGISYRVADITDPTSLETAITEDFDAVVNTVALIGSRKSWELFRKVNVEGAKNLAEAMRKVGNGRLVHLSSVAVYGKAAVNGAENLIPERPKFMKYSVTKLESEEALRRYSDLNVTFLRPGHVTGPRDRMGVLPLLYHSLRKNRFVLIDEGKALSSFVYVKDVCQAVRLCLEKPNETKAQAYNVVSPEKVTIMDIVNRLHQEMDTPLPSKKTSFRAAYRKAGFAEFLAKILGRTPSVTRTDIVFIGANSHFLSDKLQGLGWQSTRAVKEMIHEWAEWRKKYESEKKEREK